jgi:DNA-binding SARP family transcriptional activator
MLVIRLLGGLELELDGEPLDPPARQSGRLLLGYLALVRGLHARGDLAALLWPEILESSARSSLRSAIAAVRRALGGNADGYLLRVGEAVGLAASDVVSVDTERFDALVAAGELEDALGMSRGPLLQGLDAEWVQQARAEHLAQISDVLGTLATQEERDGSLAAAIRYTRRQVALSPLAEPPNRDLIRRLTAAGDRASALAAYSDLAERFRRELQAVPSEQTRRLADEARRGPHASGSRAAEPLPLPPSVQAALRDPFVGRASELSLLAGLLARAARGERQVALIGGEPGIGKSALLARFAAEAGRDAAVLMARCRRPAPTAFEPFVDALDQFVRNTPPEQLERSLPAAAAELTALVPALAERLIGAPLPEDLLADGGRIERAIVETLLALCREGPLVLLIEDLHEAGEATIRLVAGLIAGEDRARLLVVLSARDPELGRSPLLQKLVRQVRALAAGTYLSLEPLDEQGIEQLASAMGHRSLPADDVHSLHARTGGNPFFASQLLASPDPLAESPLPERVQDLILDEVARLGSEVEACLAVASVVGVEFDLGTLTEVGRYGDDRALDSLDEAVAAQVVRELPSGVGRYEFRHVLIREAVYATLTATRRAHLHRRVANALRARPVESADPPLREVIEHLKHARDLVPATELADAVVAAADAARARRTYAEAATLYAEAADLLARRPEDAWRRAGVLVALGHARRRAGEGVEVLDTFFEAAGAAREMGSSELLAEAALGVCSVPFFAGDRPVDAAIAALLEEALDAVPESEEATRACLLARLAAEHVYDPARARPDGTAEQALALARRAGDPAALAAALNVSHLAYRGEDGPSRRLALARDVVQLATEEEDAETLVPAFVHQTVDQVELGELGALEANADVLTELSTRLRQPAYRWWAHLWRATAAILRGDVEKGAELAQRAFEAGRAGFGPAAELELRAQLLWLRIEQGQLDEVAAALPALEDSFSALPVWQSLKARVLAEVGRGDEAAHVVGDLASSGLARLERDTNWLISAALLAETLARTGDASGAARLRSALEPRVTHWAVSARGTVCLGPLAGSLSLVSAVEGRAEEAERYYRMALGQCERARAALAARRLEREYRSCGPHAVAIG